MLTCTRRKYAGKGILAVDESTKTIGKRLQSINVENTEANRQAYRGLLFTTPGIGNYISGAILYEETLFQNNKDGTPFVQNLRVSVSCPIYADAPLPCRCSLYTSHLAAHLSTLHHAVLTLLAAHGFVLVSGLGRDPRYQGGHGPAAPARRPPRGDLVHWPRRPCGPRQEVLRPGRPLR